MLPQISVLVSCYNSREFVPKKLAEIQAQTLFTEAEFLFIETGSPQRERELFAPFCGRHPNCRLLTTADRRPLAAAWNLGWEAARAPLVCYSNMDDVMHPRLLEVVVADFARRPWDLASVVIAQQIGNDSSDWTPARVQRLPVLVRPGPFTAWRRDLPAAFGRFDVELTIALDRDFWARAGASRLRLRLIPQLLYLYTRHPRQLSKTPGPQRDNDVRRLASKPYPPEWPAAVRHPLWWINLAARCWPRSIRPPWLSAPVPDTPPATPAPSSPN